MGYRKGADGKPEIIPEEARVIRQIYDAYLSGKSLQDIKRMLEDEGIVTKTGLTVWSMGAIQNILRNDCAIIGLNQQALMYQAVALIWFTYGSK